ncbi:MAG: MauE/DoxX family redox-associated membrane protein [Mycobacterium sp.]
MSACVAVGAMVVGSMTHLRYQAVLVQDLGTHGLWRQAHVRPIARLVTTAELLAAIVGVTVLVRNASPAQNRLTFLFIGTLFCAFSVYAFMLAHRTPGVPCGCSALQVPSSGWVLARAVGLAMLSLAAVIWPDHVITVANLEGEVALSVAGAACLGMVWWTLPSAMARVDLPARAVDG